MNLGYVKTEELAIQLVHNLVVSGEISKITGSSKARLEELTWHLFRSKVSELTPKFFEQT